MVRSGWSARGLYGGAVEMSIPAEFIDVSDVRDIPDNQEVFADSDTDQSLIVELLEPAECPDEEASKWHFKNLASEMEATNHEVQESGLVPPDFFPAAFDPATSIATMTKGIVEVSKYRDTADKSNVIEAWVACVRLRNVSTDVLITMNVPLVINPGSSSAKEGASVEKSDGPEQRILQFRTMIKSLKVKDWNLFG